MGSSNRPVFTGVKSIFSWCALSHAGPVGGSGVGSGVGSGEAVRISSMGGAEGVEETAISGIVTELVGSPLPVSLLSLGVQDTDRQSDRTSKSRTRRLKGIDFLLKINIKIFPKNC